jgi:hypothetical protein
MTASCLITSTPEFKPRSQTPPFLIATSADPPLGQLVILQPTSDELTFTAGVRSEDAGERVRVEYYVDYGFDQGNGKPFLFENPGIASLDPSTLEDTERPKASARWSRSDFGLSGCHTFTLIVSHEFGDTVRCPTDIEDSSFLTWDAIICKPNEPCPPSPFDPSLDCTPQQAKALTCGATGTL